MKIWIPYFGRLKTSLKINKKLPFLFYGLLLSSQIHSVDDTGYWIKKNNIHHRTDTYKQDVVRMSFAELKRKMDKDCLSKRSHSYYTCYNLAVYLIRRKDYKTAGYYLKHAYRQNNQFFYSVNTYRQLFPNNYHDIFADSQDKKYHLFYLAAVSAKKKDVNKTIYYLQKASILGLDIPSLIKNDPAFFSVLKNVKMKKFMNDKFSQRNINEVNRLSYLFLKNSPLFGIIDEEYTWYVHKKKPDPEKVLYHYYKARSYAYYANAKGVITELENVFNKLKGKSISRDHQISLQRYFLLFVLQNKPFTSMKNNEYKKYINEKCDKYDIPNTI